MKTREPTWPSKNVTFNGTARFLTFGSAPLQLLAALSWCLFVRDCDAFTSSIQSHRLQHVRDFRTVPTEPSRQYVRSNNMLSMHMGHSHEHHHHHHHAATTTTPQSRKRRLQVVFAMGLSMMAQPLVWKQRISKSHVLVSTVASIFVYMAQPFAVSTVSRFRQWMQGISKHTPRYAPNNAADRVTVLG